MVVLFGIAVRCDWLRAWVFVHLVWCIVMVDNLGETFLLGWASLFKLFHFGISVRSSSLWAVWVWLRAFFDELFMPEAWWVVDRVAMLQPSWATVNFDRPMVYRVDSSLWLGFGLIRVIFLAYLLGIGVGGSASLWALSRSLRCAKLSLEVVLGLIVCCVRFAAEEL